MSSLTIWSGCRGQAEGGSGGWLVGGQKLRGLRWEGDS